MDISHSEESRTPGSHHEDASPVPVSRKTRVRTGCLVCRARKVKCDEQRPRCQKCIRMKRQCVYTVSTKWNLPRTPPAELDTSYGLEQQMQANKSHQRSDIQSQVEPNNYFSPQEHGILQPETPISGVMGVLSIPDDLVQPDTGAQLCDASAESSSPHDSELPIGTHCPSAAETPSERHQKTSQLIYLSTVVDWMAACETPSPSSFCYFIDVVDCPLLAPFDHLNWTRVKQYIAYLGFEQTAIAESILAVQALYRAQVDHLPKTHALSLHQGAVNSFQSMLGDKSVEFDIILISAFLLCLCAVILPNEDDSHLGAFDEAFQTRLETWSHSHHHKPVSLRICAWLQILNTATKHPGSVGLFPAAILNLLYTQTKEVPGLSSMDSDQHPERGLYDIIATPVFAFYLNLQKISNQVTDLTHYRRSRTTPEDQAEVTELLNSLKADLACLWDKRPAPLHLQPDKIRGHFSAEMSSPLIALVGLCVVAFHTELIVIGRISGDSSFPSLEAKHALGRIRDVVQGDWNAYINGTLNPGYVRPVFVYALESPQRSESNWAIDRLREITHPISRGNFLASFIQEHSEAQRIQCRRVTMKYFCYQKFGVPLPYM